MKSLLILFATISSGRGQGRTLSQEWAHPPSVAILQVVITRDSSSESCFQGHVPQTSARVSLIRQCTELRAEATGPVVEQRARTHPLLPTTRTQAGKTNKINPVKLSTMSEHTEILWKLPSVTRFKGGFITETLFCEFWRILTTGPQVRNPCTQVTLTRVVCHLDGAVLHASYYFKRTRGSERVPRA